MINVLIADDNIYYAKKLMDYINNSSNDIRICNIAITGKEAYSLLNDREDVDLILLDYNLPIYTGIEVLQMLSESKKKKYMDSCLLITGESKLPIALLKDNPIIHKLLYKGLSMSELLIEINKLLNAKKLSLNNLRQRITNEVTFLGYNISHKGTINIIDTIYYIYTHPAIYSSFKNEIYPIIAFHYKDSCHNVKCNMTRATEEMYCNCDLTILKKYFSYFDDIKPTVKTVVYTIINKLKN